MISVKRRELLKFTGTLLATDLLDGNFQSQKRATAEAYRSVADQHEPGEEVRSVLHQTILPTLPDNHTDYIVPESEVVREWASNIDVRTVKNTGRGDDRRHETVDRGRFPELERRADIEEFKIDDWQHPERYLGETMAGDCEDYAVAAASIYENHGFNSRVVLGLRNGEAHTLAELKEDGLKSYTTIGRLGRTVTESTLDEMCDWEPVFYFDRDTELTVHPEYS
jgi:hypothetical protein